MYITSNTISTIEKQENGKFKLTFYSNKTAVFSRMYNTFRGAQIAESKLMKKYAK